MEYTNQGFKAVTNHNIIEANQTFKDYMSMMAELNELDKPDKMPSFSDMVADIFNDEPEGMPDFFDLYGPIQYKFVHAYAKLNRESMIADMIFLLFPKGIKYGIPGFIDHDNLGTYESIESFMLDLAGQYETESQRLKSEIIEFNCFDSGYYHGCFGSENDEHRHFDNQERSRDVSLTLRRM